MNGFYDHRIKTFVETFANISHTMIKKHYKKLRKIA